MGMARPSEGVERATKGSIVTTELQKAQTCGSAAEKGLQTKNDTISSRGPEEGQRHETHYQLEVSEIVCGDSQLQDGGCPYVEEHPPSNWMTNVMKDAYFTMIKVDLNDAYFMMTKVDLKDGYFMMTKVDLQVDLMIPMTSHHICLLRFSQGQQTGQILPLLLMYSRGLPSPYSARENQPGFAK